VGIYTVVRTKWYKELLRNLKEYKKQEKHWRRYKNIEFDLEMALESKKLHQRILGEVRQENSDLRLIIVKLEKEISSKE